MYCGLTIDKSDFYLNREHLNVVKSLHNYNIIIISKLDKSAVVVILNKDYDNKMADILRDTTKLKIFDNVDEFDKIAIEEKRIRKLLEYLQNLHIPKKIRSQRPRLYGLPEIHKIETPLKPILSMVGSAQHSHTKWLADIVEPVVQLRFQHCIRDLFNFTHQIHNISIYPNNTLLYSFDMMSLYNNVPLDETIADTLYSSHLSLLPVPETTRLIK